MCKKLLLLALILIMALSSACSTQSKDTNSTNELQQPLAAMSDSAAPDDGARISIVAIKEKGSAILDKSGSALKYGGQYISKGSNTIVKKTGNILVDVWNWCKAVGISGWQGCKRVAAATGDWFGEQWDSLINSDPMKKELVASSLKKLTTEVTAYNQTVLTVQNSMDQLYETKNKTSITLKAVEKYTQRLGRLPLGYDSKLSATKKDFDKYDDDLKAIQEKVNKSKWNVSDDIDNLGDAAAAAGGNSEDAKKVDKAGELILKIASACGKEDASGMIDTFKGAAKVAMSVGSILAVSGADMGVTALLVVAGPIVLQIVDVTSNVLSERTANKKMAAEAIAKCQEVAAARIKLEQFNQKVLTLDNAITGQEAKVATIMSALLKANVDNYEKASLAHKQQINILVDESNNLSKLLVTTVKQ